MVIIMAIGKLGSSQDRRDLKEKNEEIFKEAPSFTTDEIEILKIFKEKCSEKGINAEELLDKLNKTK